MDPLSLEEIEEKQSNALQLHIYNSIIFKKITPSGSKFLYFLDGPHASIHGPVELPKSRSTVRKFLTKRYNNTYKSILSAMRRDGYHIPKPLAKTPTHDDVESFFNIRSRINSSLVPNKYVVMMVCFFNHSIKDLDLIFFPVRWYSPQEVGNVLSTSRSVMDLVLSAHSHMKRDEEDEPLKRVFDTDLDAMD